MPRRFVGVIRCRVSFRSVTFTDGFVVNSNVISCSIQPKPKRVIYPPVTVILHHIKEMNNAESKCVFWDFNAGATGGWSSEGCWLAKSNRSTTICKCNHLTHFAILSNTYDQKVNAKEQSKEKVMAFVWLGIPLSIMLVVGALYTCFSWSKDPRRRHVVLMDKKPTLPRETDAPVETPIVSEKFEPSPKRILYASNPKICPTLPNSPQKSQRKWVVSPCKSSKSSHSDQMQSENNGLQTPSDLEWEHAWDFLANSNFAGSTKKDIYPDLKKKILGITMDVYEKPVSMVSGTTAKIAKWNYQDDTEWSSDRIKCLSKGSSQTTVDQAYTDDEASFHYQSDTQISESFCPVGISSPQSSLSGREDFHRSESLRHGKNYLRISFDADVDISSGTSSRQSASLQGSDKDLCSEEKIEIEVVKQRVTKIVNSLHSDCTAYNDAYKTSYSDSVLLNSSQVLTEFALNNREILNNTLNNDDDDDDDTTISLNLSLDDNASNAYSLTIEEHDSSMSDITLGYTDNYNNIDIHNWDKHIFRVPVHSGSSPYQSPCEKDCCYIGLDMLFQDFEDSLEDIPTNGRLTVTPDESINSLLDTGEGSNCDMEDLNSTFEYQSRAISNIRSYLCHDELESSLSSIHDYAMTYIPPELSDNSQHDTGFASITTTPSPSTSRQTRHQEYGNTSEDSGYILNKDSLFSPIDSLDHLSVEEHLVKESLNRIESSCSNSSLIDTSTDSFLSEVNVAFQVLPTTTSDVTTSSPTLENKSFVDEIRSIINNSLLNRITSTEDDEEQTNSETSSSSTTEKDDDSEDSYESSKPPPHHINDLKTSSKTISKKPKVDVAKNMMTSTAISANGCRVKRRQKGNKQSPAVNNPKTPTRHMKSYIALRMQCRMNETSTMKSETETHNKKSKTNKTSKTSPVKSSTSSSSERNSPVKLSPEKSNLLRSHSNLERLSPTKCPSYDYDDVHIIREPSKTAKPLRSCVKKTNSDVTGNIDTVNENLRQLKESSNKRQQSSTGAKRRTLRFATEYQIAFSRENIPAKVEQGGFKSKERLSKHWGVAKHPPRQLNVYKNPYLLNEPSDPDIEVDKSLESNALLIEQRAFAGQLRRWVCEELASKP